MLSTRFTAGTRTYLTRARNSEPTHIFATLIPPGVLDQTLSDDWLAAAESIDSRIGHAEYRRKIERYLDYSAPESVLTKPTVAACLVAQLCDVQSDNYEMRAWAILHSHLHFSMVVRADADPERVFRRWLVKTGRALSGVLKHDGRRRFWAAESDFCYTIGAAEQRRAIWQIRTNPVRCGLSDGPEDYRFSSSWPSYAVERPQT